MRVLLQRLLAGLDYSAVSRPHIQYDPIEN
jgi:hypothetical protein